MVSFRYSNVGSKKKTKRLTSNPYGTKYKNSNVPKKKTKSWKKVLGFYDNY